MMVLNYLSLALGLLALISAIALLKALFLKEQLASLQKRSSERIAKLENELSALLDGSFGMGNQLNELQRDMKDTREKQQQLEQRDLGALPYNQAVRMVASGATADQLVNQCGLSRSEADLIMLLHKSSPPVVEPIGTATRDSKAQFDNQFNQPDRVDTSELSANTNREFMDDIAGIDALPDEDGLERLDTIEGDDEPIENQSEQTSSIERANQPKGE